MSNYYAPPKQPNKLDKNIRFVTFDFENKMLM
jgi:hypothetical protein